jgi:hypothetical protein
LGALLQDQRAQVVVIDAGFFQVVDFDGEVPFGLIEPALGLVSFFASFCVFRGFFPADGSWTYHVKRKWKKKECKKSFRLDKIPGDLGQEFEVGARLCTRRENRHGSKPPVFG